MADELALRFEEQSSLRGKGRPRGGGGRRGGGRGAEGSRDIDISRTLTRLLRHQAENAGIKLDKEGYAPLDRVLNWAPLRSLSVNFSDVQKAVAESDKQRFSLKTNPETNPTDDTSSTEPSDWLVRANQGHSIKLESAGLLKPITPDNVPPTVVHGTYFAFWPLIVESGGLRRMGRNHVHCSTGLPGDDSWVVSGMRKDAELLVYIDVRQSLEDGALAWWVSDNGVVLTEGTEEGLVPAKYFKEVVGRRREDVGVLWKDGEKVADLPPGIKVKTPYGKRGGRGGGRGGRGDGSRGGGRS